MTGLRKLDCVAGAVLPEAAACGEVDRVLIDFDRRHRRRIVLPTVAGGELLLDLPQAVRLRDGDGLQLEDGGVVRVRRGPSRCWRSTPTTRPNWCASPGTSATAICRCSCSATASASAPTT